MNKTCIKILLVDDDPDIQEFVSYNLRKESYLVFIAGNGAEATKIAEKEKPDLIILDVMMPGIDGIQTCQTIRNIDGLQNVIITFLSARSEDYTQIAGYDAGADDFIHKPIKPAILIKKVKSLLRRVPVNKLNSTFSIDSERYLVTVENRQIVLPKKEFYLLKLLYSNPGKVFSRQEIYDAVWGDSVIVGDRTIDVHIRKIRKKIGDKYIQTLKGIGYSFEND